MKKEKIAKYILVCLGSIFMYFVFWIMGDWGQENYPLFQPLYLFITIGFLLFIWCMSVLDINI